MSTQTFIGTLIVKTCPTCGITYGVPERFDREKHDDQTSWCCPNGHSLHYIQSTAVKLQAELDQMKASRDWEAKRAQWAREDADRERRSHSATKGVLTKTRKRAEHGVCLHCWRRFANVARHVEHMHPDA